jgi:hypothetical protein
MLGSVKNSFKAIRGLSLCAALVFLCAPAAQAQTSARPAEPDQEFGPIVRAYLGYLRNQQEVVDDRISRREVDRAYYVRNSNRIRALRRAAVRIARESGNDFLPELEAVTADEFDLLLDEPPRAQELKTGQVLNFQLRYLESVVSGRDKFYVFARLDPYEQAELKKQGQTEKTPPADAAPAHTPAPDASAKTPARPRRTVSP